MGFLVPSCESDGLLRLSAGKRGEALLGETWLVFDGGRSACRSSILGLSKWTAYAKSERDWTVTDGKDVGANEELASFGLEFEN